MRTLELSRDPRIVAVVFEPGEEPISGLTEVAQLLGLSSAAFTAIGAFRRATVGWFDLDRRDYRRIAVEEQVEVLSLVGDITQGADRSNPRVHGHVVLGHADGHTVGGHLLEAAVRPTLEVVVTESPAELRRRHDPATGLALIDLDASTDSVGASATQGASHGQDRR